MPTQSHGQRLSPADGTQSARQADTPSHDLLTTGAEPSAMFQIYATSPSAAGEHHSLGLGRNALRISPEAQGDPTTVPNATALRS